jgi:glycosyltransferase involved in cell wall biosynthesis
MKKRPISVLLFSNVAVRAGAEEHILALLQGLDRKVFRLSLVCPEVLAEKLLPDLPADVELVPLYLDKPTQIVAALRLAQVLRRRQVDILHSHMFRASLFASPIGWLCRVPVIIETAHGPEAWRHGWLKGRFVVDRWVGHFVDYFIAVSEANARYLIEEKGLPERKIFVIWNGIDLTRFNPAHPAPIGIKRSIGFDDGDPLLLVVGRLDPQKGHHVLLDAFPAVRQEFPGARLVCIGDGALRGELEGKARSLGLEGAVRFLGYQSNVPDWLAAADATVLPSFYEGLPLTAIECLAAGKPMVATSVDGTPEVVVNEKTGLTVPPGNAELLAAAICRLLREAELRKRLGVAGRRWVEEHFSIERQIFKTQELYLRAWEQSAKARNTELRKQLSERWKGRRRSQ